MGSLGLSVSSVELAALYLRRRLAPLAQAESKRLVGKGLEAVDRYGGRMRSEIYGSVAASPLPERLLVPSKDFHP